LEKRGVAVTYVGVDRYGMIDPEEVRRALRPETALVTLQHANPEVGTVQPVAEVGRIAREHGVPFHLDAAASAGWLPLHVAEIGADLATVAAQAFHGPKGAATLYVRRGVKLQPQWQGGTQEEGLRPGAENMPTIVGMGAAAEVAAVRGAAWAAGLVRLREHLLDPQRGLPAKLPSATLTGHRTQRLPGHVSFVVEGVDGESLLLQLSAENIYAAQGSSCTTLAMKPSHVLTAMGIDSSLAQGALIVSLGLFNTEEDVARLVEVVPRLVEAIRILIPHGA
jgi:cysteine desulfurase